MHRFTSRSSIFSTMKTHRATAENVRETGICQDAGSGLSPVPATPVYVLYFALQSQTGEGPTSNTRVRGGLARHRLNPAREPAPIPEQSKTGRGQTQADRQQVLAKGNPLDRRVALCVNAPP